MVPGRNIVKKPVRIDTRRTKFPRDLERLRTKQERKEKWLNGGDREGGWERDLRLPCKRYLGLLKVSLKFILLDMETLLH